MGDKSAAQMDWMPSLKENWLFFLLIFSLYVGQGISYGQLCLFHISIPLYFLKELRLGLNWRRLLEKNALPFHLFYLMVFVISTLHPLNYAYLYFYGLGYLIFSLLWMKKDFILANYRSILLFFLGLFSLEILIASLEFLTPFRYPISRLSTINHWFGRDYNFFASRTECFDWNYVLSSPTGFQWNQNNLAFVLIFFFSFTFLIKNSWLKNILRTIISILVVSTGARLGFYALTFLYLILWISECRLWQWQQLLPILTLSFILTDGFYILPTQMKKVKEVSITSQSVFTDRFPNHCYEKLSSTETRLQLMKEGKVLIIENWGLGKGAGGFTQRMKDWNQRKNYKSQLAINAHNFLMELMVDFGIFILFPLALMLYTVCKNLIKKTWQDWTLFITASVSIFAGSLMISSPVYFLPMYLFFFLLYIYLTSEKISLYFD
jgi:hypothetical protein